jgi:transcriptional regulator with XRE-family HTH domain
MNTNINLSKRLRTLRQDNNLTQKQVAEYLRLKPRTYQAYEEARCEPSLSTICKLCDLYMMAGIDELIGKEPGEKKNELVVRYKSASPEKRNIVDYILGL